MPIYDRKCEKCGLEDKDRYEQINTEDPSCECGGLMKRMISLPAVIPDEIPGGIEIRHGLCNEDGTPKRYYSKSEITKEAKKRGLENRVEHRIAESSGSDKSPHTSRWY